jgi:hypothetical protein
MRFADQHVAATATVLTLAIRLTLYVLIIKVLFLSSGLEGGDCSTQMCLMMLLVLYFKFLKIKHGAHVVKFSLNLASIKYWGKHQCKEPVLTPL